MATLVTFFIGEIFRESMFPFSSILNSINQSNMSVSNEMFHDFDHYGNVIWFFPLPDLTSTANHMCKHSKN